MHDKRVYDFHEWMKERLKNLCDEGQSCKQGTKAYNYNMGQQVGVDDCLEIFESTFKEVAR